MKIIYLITALLLLAFVFNYKAEAQNKSQTKNFNVSSNASASPQGNQVQNQNQLQTQNSGEEQNLQVENQEQESLQAGESAPGYENKTESPKSQRAKQQMSNVAQKVEELLTTQGAKGGIGDQISKFAQQQKQAENQIASLLKKMESKTGIMKTLFGPDYGAVKNLKKQVEENQERIKLLQQLQSQVQNQADESQLEETIQALISFNNALQDRIQAEEKVKSIFGWFIKLFS